MVDAQPKPPRVPEAGLVHPTAKLRESRIGRWCELSEGAGLAHSTLGDWSYLMEGAQAAHAAIGKFCAVAAGARINAPNHPMERAALAWWDWPEERLRSALGDFRDLPVEAFLARHGG